MSRTTLEQWQTFQAVVDCGGFAQAAEKLNKSQSSISYTVNQLQTRLGFKLLRQDGRKAQLTDLGKTLLRRSRSLLNEASELEAFASQLDQGWESEIHLVVDSAFPLSLILDALMKFEKLGRRSRVQLAEVVLSGADEAVEIGQADIVIGTTMSSDLLADEIIEIEFELVAHSDHPLSNLDRPVVVGDLEKELQVVVKDSGSEKQQDMGWLGAEHRWTVGSIEAATEVVSYGLGYAWLPKYKIVNYVESGILKLLDLQNGRQYSVKLYRIFTSQNPGPAVIMLSDLLRSAADEWQP